MTVLLALNTPNDKIDVWLDGADVNLRTHEEEHKRIYIEYGNVSWEIKTTVSRRTKSKDLCKKIKADYWPSVEMRFRNMLNMQNAWDDKDTNNVSHERINVNFEIEKLKKQWQDSVCE